MNNQDTSVPGVIEYGKKIGFYLENLDMPLEIKQGIANLIPYLEPEQIDEFAMTLENALIEQVAVESTPEYQDKSMQIDQDTMAQIDSLIASSK